MTARSKQILHFLATGYLAAIVLTGARCTRPRRPNVYSIPEGYRGWVQIRYQIPTCPALERRDGKYLIEIPPTGEVCTSTAPEYGEAVDEYYVVGATRRRINWSGWGQGGMIWGDRIGGPPGSTVQRFFVGAEEEYKAASASPENWFKVTEFASDDESGKGLKSDVLSLLGSRTGSQRILWTV